MAPAAGRGVPRGLYRVAAYVEAALAAAASGERAQFKRTGYFVVDSEDSAPSAPVFN